MRSVTLILPATDETFSLEQTLERSDAALRDRDVRFLIVTSMKMTTQACRDSIQKLTQKFGTRVESFDQKKPGIGGALQDSFEHLHTDIAVVMASDLETDPAVLPALLEKIDDGYDIAATTRWKSGARFENYDPLKLVLNFFFQHFFRLLYWTSLTDLTYAYRAYRTEVLKGIRWEEMRFPFLFETIVKPLRLGYRVTEVEAPWRARTEGMSHNSFGQTLDYVRVGIRVRFLPKRKILYTEPQ